MFVLVLPGSTLGDITKVPCESTTLLSVVLFSSRTVFVLVPVLLYFLFTYCECEKKRKKEVCRIGRLPDWIDLDRLVDWLIGLTAEFDDYRIG